MHVISADEALRALPGGSALDACWDALQRLRDLGRGTAERWLEENLAAVGARPTLDLALFARPAIEIRAEGGCSATIWKRGRIASPEMLLRRSSLPHLGCSRAAVSCGGNDEAGEHDDAG